MNSIICLALSCLLVGLLYVYMRQQFAAQDRKISDLTQLVASVATELQQQTGPYPFAAPPQHPAMEVKRLPERVTVSDDSESEVDTDDEDDSDSESEDEVEKKETNTKEKEKEKEPSKTTEVEVKEEYPTIETEDIVEDTSIILDIGEGVKTINLFDTVEVVKQNYDKLTVKELKDLVSKESGPASLKTKKDLIDFLEKKK